MTGLLAVITPSVKFEKPMNSDALLAHVENLREPLRILFEQFATDHSVVIYGDPSAQLLENAQSRRIDFEIYSFLQGL
jgi:hypothetical protein